MTLIKYIYGLLQEAHLWFKEYIKTVKLKSGLKQRNNDPCILYRVNEIWTEIIIVYVDDTLVIVDKQALIDTIEFTNKDYAT